ncbi:MAG: SDR family oxidoreductase [Bacteroidetes bacterium]|nr:SDR family oxidoreductase [Bacteroidota bacterium]
MSYALITGASKGIGKALSYELAKRKFDLLLVARSEPLLKELTKNIEQDYHVDVKYFVSDITLPRSPEKIANWCSENKLSLKILVNNAGFGLQGLFDQLSIDEQMNMMQLNMASLVSLTYHLLPNLKKNVPAYILNISSTAAYQAIPGLNVYAATKSFVLSFSRGLRIELSKTTVSVSCVCPGPTDTHFTERAKMLKLHERTKKFFMKPEVVAKIAVKGMFNGKAEIIPGLLNKISSLASYYFPKKFLESIAARIYIQDL